MPSLQIRDLPQEIYDELVASTEQNRRSLTQEAVTILERDLIKPNSSTRKLNALKKIQSMQHHFSGVTNEEIVAIIRIDRDH